MGRPIGCFALKENGNAIVALSDGFYEFDFAKNHLTFINNPEENKPNNRFNDGTTDIKGRFFAGTMPISNASARDSAQGSLYCLDLDHSVKFIMDNFFILNGLTFSPDGRTSYISDTVPFIRKIWAFDYDIDNAQWSNKRLFFDTHAVNGRPDGGSMDTDGCYWMAGVGGWELVRITPNGTVDMRIKMPIEKPTRIAFGGKNFDVLYVTSIGQNGISPGTFQKQPNAGGIFSLRIPGIQGVPTSFFQG